VPPEQAVFAFKVAVHELERLVRDGLTGEQFETTRQYLMKNVFLMTKTQDQQLGYALDSRWYGIGEFTAHMREQLAGLTRDRVNEAVRRHISATEFFAVFVSGDGARLRDELLSDEPTTIAYDAPKPADLLDEDKVIGARRLGIRAEAIRITPVEDVFAR